MRVVSREANTFHAIIFILLLVGPLFIDYYYYYYYWDFSLGRVGGSTRFGERSRGDGLGRGGRLLSRRRSRQLLQGWQAVGGRR